jgi:hypothetical protein
MTKEEFILGYCNRSNITIEQFNDTFVALPCNCGDDSCRGWAVINNSKICIDAYNKTHSK